MRKLLLFYLVLVVQCTTSTQKEPKIKKYFDIIDFTQALIQNQSNAHVIARIKTQVNGIKEAFEKTKTDSTFWATELFMLLQMDINKPSLLTAYSVQEHIPEPNSNLLKTIYVALPTTSYKVKKIEIKYLAKPHEIRQISGVIEIDNPVYVTHQAFHIWLNKQGEKILVDSLITSGFNKTIFLDSMVYSSSLKAESIP